jgi:5-methylcytosine-specific restriction endonuclease McrA
MSKRYTKYRLIAFRNQKFRNQNGVCYYCNAPMWLRKIGSFATKHGISDQQALHFQCTTEHLVARQDGGADSRKNIVAACRFCNETRHQSPDPLPAQKYASLIARQLNRGEWHPIEFHPLIVNHSHE